MSYFPKWESPPYVTWRNVAVHEAGHAVLMRHFGIDPGLAEISADGQSGYVSLGVNPVPIGELPQHADGAYMAAYLDLKNGVPPREAALQAAIIYVGGYQAEVIAAGLNPTGLFITSCTDTRRARSALAAELRTESPLYWCQAQARYLLQMKWDEVLRIAASLEIDRVVRL
jgi:hypothetical protein